MGRHYTVSIDDIDDCLGYPSCFKQLAGPMEDQLAQSKTPEFLKAVGNIPVAPWVKEHRSLLDDADEHIVVTGRHSFMKDITTKWLLETLGLRGISIQNYLCFTDYTKYLQDKQRAIASTIAGLEEIFWKPNIIAATIRAIFKNGYRVKVFDDSIPTIKYVQSLEPSGFVTGYLIKDGRLLPRQERDLILARV